MKEERYTKEVLLIKVLKNKCLFIQEYQIPIFELVVLYLIGPLRKDSSLWNGLTHK